jgi:hypothetical protein
MAPVKSSISFHQYHPGLRNDLDPQNLYGPDFPGETFRVLKKKEIRMTTIPLTVGAGQIDRVIPDVGGLLRTKGIEYEPVIIYNGSESNYNTQKYEGRLLNVAATRTLHQLSILYSGQLSGHLAGNPYSLTQSIKRIFEKRF